MPDITMKAIQNEIDALTRRMDKLRATLENAELRRDALQLTLEHFQPAQKQKRRRATTLDVSPDELRDKSIDEALVYIAERNKGVVPSTAARKVLIEAGVLKGSQVGNRLWAALNRSERFEREEKGRYRLIPEEEDTPLLTPSVFISKSSR